MSKRKTKRRAKKVSKKTPYGERAWDLELISDGFPLDFDEWTVAWLSYVRPSGWRTIRLERYLPPEQRTGRRSLHLGWNGSRFVDNGELKDLVERYTSVYVDLEDALERYDWR